MLKDEIFQAGDPTEVAGASSVFADSRRSDDPLIIGSVRKSPDLTMVFSTDTAANHRLRAI